MSDKVWVSAAMSDSRLLTTLRADIFDSPNFQEVNQFLVKNEYGYPFSVEHFPKKIYWVGAGKKKKKLAPFFNTGLFYVSEELANVLRQFDLGECGLYPVTLYEKDRKTVDDRTYFTINFGNRKRVFLPNESPAARVGPLDTEEGETRRLPMVPDHDLIAVSPAALIGPDLWIDENLAVGIFVSGRLYDALKAANLARVFGFKRCRIVVQA